jgi:muramoyltetrapeptide carboxypeptidase
MQRYKFVSSSVALAKEGLLIISTNMIRPPNLEPGNKVGIVAPARKVNREEMAPAIKMLSSWGYDVIEGRHLYNEENQYSGSDEQRTADFQYMLDDPDIKAIFSARGGYGSVRIIDKLDFSSFTEHPKWIVGYSDITVFHSHINRHTGVQTLHAGMPINFPPGGKMNSSLESMKTILQGENPEYQISGHPFNRPGTARGILTGGNLSVLYSMSGTPSDIETGGKILFLEDLDEYLYHIDRMMMNLKRSGKLEGLAGLVVGGMNDMNDNEIPYGQSAYEIIADAVSDYSYPVLFGFPAGHAGENLGLIMRGRYELDVDSNCSQKLKL